MGHLHNATRLLAISVIQAPPTLINALASIPSLIIILDHKDHIFPTTVMSTPEAPLRLFQVTVPSIKDDPIHIGIVLVVLTSPELELFVMSVVWRGTMEESVIFELPL